MKRLSDLEEKLRLSIKAEESRYELFIFDVNGVLDDLYGVKEKIIRGITKDENLTKKIIVAIERLYENNKASDPGEVICNALHLHDIKLDASKVAILRKNYFALNKISEGVLNLLKDLGDKRIVCLYTSLTLKNLKKLYPFPKWGLGKIQLFTQESFIERKPSINNLIKICSANNVKPEKTILFGDNVAVDLMPAKLLGMKTVLVSCYVDVLVSNIKKL